MLYKKKQIIAVLCYLLLACLLFKPQFVFAATEQAEIVTTDQQKDLVVMFTFDKKVVDITFISPSGTVKTVDDGDVTYTNGDLWSTYRISNAEVGTWSVQYDLNVNSEIGYSVIEDDYGLWIQYFEVDEINSEKAIVRFEADCESETLNYKYTIYAVDTADTSSYTELSSGYVKSGEEKTTDFKLTSITSGNYVLRLDVYYQEGEAELFDSLTTDSFDYTNPDEPDSIEDYALSIDAGNLTCDIDWSEFANWGYDSYKLLVYGDDEQLYIGEMDNKTTMTGVVFPDETQQLTVELCYKKGGVWSKPLSKTVDLNKEYLRLTTEDVTNSNQVTLEYLVSSERTLEVSINDTAGNYVLRDGGTLSFDLQQGNNSIYARFESDSLISFVIDTEVYFDEYPPEIKLYEDLDGKTLYDDSIDILGKITGGNSLIVNGKEAEIGDDGEFCVTVNLNFGENIVSIEALDANGNSSVMNLTLYKASKVIGGDASKIGLLQFLPLLAAVLSSLLIIVLSYAFMKNKDKTQAVKSKRVWTWILWDFFLAVMEAGCIFGFATCYRYVNSMAYLELAERSASLAVKYLRLEKEFGIASFIVLVLLIVSIWITALKIKKKKDGIGEEEV